eukprot:m.109639 g.109639  ORF g.109639 m.109639 type:complete len:440 (-) comp19152_c0_seq8:38-1357(-)
MLQALLAALLMVAGMDAVTNILDLGAVPDNASVAAGRANSRILVAAFLQANTTDGVVLIPAGHNFTIFNSTMYNLHHIKLHLEGFLVVSDNISAANWPPPHTDYGCLHFLQSSFIEITGGGGIDGQGYNFWWEAIINPHPYRPHMLVMEQVHDIQIHDVQFYNSPNYHVDIRDARTVHLYNLQVWVDVEKQRSMLAQQGHMLQGGSIPTFPLNTDGFDIGAQDVLMENVTIQNFDDAVAVKPLTGASVYSNCSQNMLIRNCVVYDGVGMSIGSVPPHANTNCVRNITFEHIVFHHPLKAVYIKTNPGNVGTGIIDQITYRNLTAFNSVWYPIWIGPQQQQQPFTKGTGCSFLFPIDNQCPTQPLVPITNIHLEEVNFLGGLTLPGVLLCNATKPCTGFTFDNVQNSGEFAVQKEYFCANVHGSERYARPAPSCLAPALV